MTYIHSEISGPTNAPVLLLSNSLGATLTMWDAQMPLFEQYFRVIRYDTRGHGQSDAPDGPYSWDDLVGDAFGVLDRYGIDTATVVGISLGAMTALGMALAQPSRLDRIVCCSGRADAPQPFAKIWDDRVAVLDEAGIEAVWNGTRPKWLTDTFQSVRPDNVIQLRAGFLQTTPQGYRGCAAALKELDFLRHLGGMNVPTLCVAGSADAVTSPETMRAIADACLDGAYAEVPDAAHIVNINQVQGFNLALAGFLEMY